jgi:transcription initiation factor IIE alpha subunit
MKEDDICELLKFERKMLRARISTLRNDKFIQVRLKMETGLDGKAQKVNYYFINYKVRKHIIVSEVVKTAHTFLVRFVIYLKFQFVMLLLQYLILLQ